MKIGNKVFLILFLQLYTVSISCFNSFGYVKFYKVKNNEIIYEEFSYAPSAGFSGAKISKIIEDIDIETFIELDKNGFAKDKNNVYYDGEILEKIDINTFEVISRSEKCLPGTRENYIIKFKDKNGEYEIEDIINRKFEYLNLYYR